MKNLESEVQYLSEFVLTKNGNIDFGEIPENIAKEIKRQAGKIRLRIGKHSASSGESSENYGEAHISRTGRLKQLQNAGFETARDFVDFIGKNYTAIYSGGGRSLKLSFNGEKDFTMFVQLEPCDEGDFYDVKTAMITRKSYLKKETPLWTKPVAEL